MDTDNTQPATVFNVEYSPDWFVSPEEEIELDSSQATVALQVQGHTRAMLESDPNENSYVRNAIEHLVQALNALPSHDFSNGPMRKLIYALRSLCRGFHMIPQAYTIPVGSVKKLGEEPNSYGGCADVWKGTHTPPNGPSINVAIKRIRVNLQQDISNSKKIMQMVCQEVILWKQLDQHKNITPMIGVDNNGFSLCLVSEWMEHGNIAAYLHKAPDSNRMKLLVDVSQGLNHLHSQGAIHGDIKPANVLIDSEGHARLCDFGMTTLMHTVQNSIKSSTVQGNQGTTQYMAPEILHPEMFGKKDGHPSKPADIYAMAMLMWEVFSGEAPWKDVIPASIRLPQIVAIQGQRPLRPKKLPMPDALWDLIEICWRQQPSERPEAMKVLNSLEGL